MNSLQGKRRYENFQYGLQILSFDERVGHHEQFSMDKTIEGSPFASVYFCRNFLPNDLIIEHLNKYPESIVILTI